jgi:hypothetical protein
MPCVAMCVTLVTLPKSTCNHWWALLDLATHPPRSDPARFISSLARAGEWFWLYMEEAVMRASGMAPLFIPRGELVLQDTDKR